MKIYCIYDGEEQEANARDMAALGNITTEAFLELVDKNIAIGVFEYQGCIIKIEADIKEVSKSLSLAAIKINKVNMKRLIDTKAENLKKNLKKRGVKAGTIIKDSIYFEDYTAQGIQHHYFIDNEKKTIGEMAKIFEVAYKTMTQYLVGLKSANINGREFHAERNDSLKEIDYLFDGLNMYENVTRREYKKITGKSYNDISRRIISHGVAVNFGWLAFNGDLQEAIKKISYIGFDKERYYFGQVPSLIRDMDITLKRSQMLHHITYTGFFHSGNKIITKGKDFHKFTGETNEK
ncbi:MAG: hypothetical protein GY928_08080 [Colwellia sp.]|nr:hypothetical protein [Colwellia sp.]